MATQQAAAQRKNTKKTVKFYDEQTVNGWKYSFEYETVNGVISGKSQCTAVNGSKTIVALVQNGQTTISTSNYEQDVVANMVAELNAINAEFAEIDFLNYTITDKDTK